MSQAVAYDTTNHMIDPTPLQLTIMCYEEVIKSLHQAKRLHQSNSIDAAFQRNQHAQDLITELLLGLDYEQGGDIARNLSRLYDFALRQLVGMGSGTDVSAYNHLIHIFGDLKEAWAQIDAQRS